MSADIAAFIVPSVLDSKALGWEEAILPGSIGPISAKHRPLKAVNSPSAASCPSLTNDQAAASSDLLMKPPKEKSAKPGDRKRKSPTWGSNPRPYD